MNCEHNNVYTILLLFTVFIFKEAKENKATKNKRICLGSYFYIGGIKLIKKYIHEAVSF